MKDSTAAAMMLVSRGNDVGAGDMAYFCPLERPHGWQIWIVVLDPSGEMNTIDSSEIAG